MNKKKKIIFWSLASVILITTFAVFAQRYYFSTWPQLTSAAGACVTCNSVFFDGRRSAQANPCGGISRTENVGSTWWDNDARCRTWYEGSCENREKCWDCDDYKYQPTETWICETCCAEPVMNLGKNSGSESVRVEKIPKTIDLGEESATCNGSWSAGSCGGRTVIRSCQSGCCSSCAFGSLYIDGSSQPSGYLYCDGHHPAEVVDTITATYPNQYTVWKIPDTPGSCSGCGLTGSNAYIDNVVGCKKCSPTWSEYCPNQCVEGGCTPQRAPNPNLCDNSRSTCSEEGWVGAWHWKVTHVYNRKGRRVDIRSGSSGCRSDPETCTP